MGTCREPRMLAAGIWILAASMLVASARGRDQRKIVDIVNNDPDSTWAAEAIPEFADYTFEDLTTLAGSFFKDDEPKILRQSTDEDMEVLSALRTAKIPDFFDARTKWPTCSSISETAWQGICGSCWAFATVMAFTDRFCIHRHKDIRLSTNQVVACCGRACTGFWSLGDGCNGGYPWDAWDYLVYEGVVSRACDPYFFSPECKVDCSPKVTTPKCHEKCSNGAVWTNDKRFGDKHQGVYDVIATAETMQNEIMTYGPITAGMDVYEDFTTYKTGVYKHITGDYLGKHAVRIIGWGVEKGVKYWLGANTWPSSWGEKNIFKFARGTNECKIETNPIAGLPA